MNPYVEVLGQVRKPNYGSEKKSHRTRFHGFHVDFGYDFGFQIGFPTVYEIYFVTDPSRGV